jgi:hypothetical protein
MKKIITAIFSIMVSLVSCSSYNKDTAAWEGISDNGLHIIISEFFPFDEKATNNQIMAIVKQRLDARASLIMASYISINLTRDQISIKNDTALNDLINNAVSSGKLISYHCSENNHCTASGEYNITELLKKLSVINNK